MAENQNTSQQPRAAEGENIREQTLERVESGETSIEQSEIQEVNVNLSPPETGNLNQWDIVLLLAFAGVSLLYGITNGKKGTAVMTVSIYMALAVTQVLPDFVLNVSWNNSAAFQVTAFIGIFALLFFFVSRSALMRTFSTDGRGSIVHILLLALLHAGLLIAVALSFVPENYLANFSPYLLQFFTGEWQVFGWVVAPIAAMLLLGRDRS